MSAISNIHKHKMLSRDAIGIPVVYVMSAQNSTISYRSGRGGKNHPRLI